MRLQEYLEEAFQDILEARTYITTNSIPVVRYNDYNTDREGLCSVIRTASVNRVAPNYPMYECMLELSAVSYKQEDIQSVSMDPLLADMQDALYIDLTKAQLQAAIDAIDVSSAITIDGLVNTSTDESDSDDFLIKTIMLNVYLTYAPA